MNDPNAGNRVEDTRAWKVCSICRVDYQGWGHNAQPINDGRCCSDCNRLVVIARMREIIRREGRVCELCGGSGRVTHPEAGDLSVACGYCLGTGRRQETIAEEGKK